MKIRVLLVTIISIVLLVTVLAACSTSAAPSPCVEAAKEAGVPDRFIEQLKSPGDLNALERIALREALERVGIGDVCANITG